MNYYLVQTKYFLIFIIVGCLALAVLPYVTETFRQITSLQNHSNIVRIQSELFFVSDFTNICYQGNIGDIVNDLYKSSNGRVICRTNPPMNSQMVICSESEVGLFECIDGSGIMCQFPYAPASGYSCRDLI